VLQVAGVGDELSLQLGNRFIYQLDADVPPTQDATVHLDISTGNPDYSKFTLQIKNFFMKSHRRK
jgi:hypothetical protein